MQTAKIKEQRQKTLSHARSLIGVKWRHRGRTAWAIDCVGLVTLSLKAAGVEINDTTHYGREPWKDSLQNRLHKRFGPPINEQHWQAGDVAVFNAPNRGASHIGFLGDYKYGGFSLIHSHAQHNTIEHALDARWRKLLIEVYSPWAV